MIRYRAELRGHVAESIRHLPPELKRRVKAAIRAIAADPSVGEALHGELQGRRKFRVRRYRLIYRIDGSAKVVDFVALGHRRTAYEELTEAMDAESKSRQR